MRKTFFIIYIFFYLKDLKKIKKISTISRLNLKNKTKKITVSSKKNKESYILGEKKYLFHLFTFQKLTFLKKDQYGSKITSFEPFT